MLLSDVQDLKEAIDEPLAIVDDIQIATPGLLNKTGYWKLEPLKRVYTGVEDGLVNGYRGEGQRGSALIFETRYADSYVYANEAKTKAELSDITLYVECPEPFAIHPKK